MDYLGTKKNLKEDNVLSKKIILPGGIFLVFFLIFSLVFFQKIKTTDRSEKPNFSSREEELRDEIKKMLAGQRKDLYGRFVFSNSNKALVLRTSVFGQEEDIKISTDSQTRMLESKEVLIEKEESEEGGQKRKGSEFEEDIFKTQTQIREVSLKDILEAENVLVILDDFIDASFSREKSLLAREIYIIIEE